MMKSQSDVLEQDLRTISNEFKKKNTQIKDVSAQTVNALSSRVVTLHLTGSK